MRLRRVFGWSLRSRAAPLGPWMTPAVASSAATMCRRSISSRGAMPSGAEARKEKHDQLRDVGTTLAQRRDRDRKHVQPVEEVGTEAPRPHRFLEIAIRRGDHPHVYPKRPARPYRFELLLLQHTKKLHLRLEGQLADLVEEDRAAIGELEAADAALQGTGEGTLHMSEQLALDQTRG